MSFEGRMLVALADGCTCSGVLFPFRKHRTALSLVRRLMHGTAHTELATAVLHTHSQWLIRLFGREEPIFTGAGQAGNWKSRFVVILVIVGAMAAKDKTTLPS